MPHDSQAQRGHEPAREPETENASTRPPDARRDDGRPPPKKTRPWHRRPLLVGTLMLVVAVGIVGGVLLWRHSRHYVSTDDAYIDVNVQRVSPQIAGRVLRVLVSDNQDVKTGDTLLELDPADLENRLEQARAGEAQAEAHVAEAEAQRTAVEAQREQAQAAEGVAAANATNAANDLRRFQELRAASAGAVTPQQLDRATAEATSTAAQQRAARTGVAAAAAQVAHALKQIDAAHAAQRSAHAQVGQAELTRSYADVKARVDGRIARLTIAPGNFVSPGSDLMAVVPRDVHVTAHFKETQLKLMRRGQAVKVKIDAYPDLELTGKVDSLQPGTGQAFELLPAQNAAGNWVKVVQRLPVKIVFDQIPDDADRRLSPGMSVKVTVTVR